MGGEERNVEKKTLNVSLKIVTRKHNTRQRINGKPAENHYLFVLSYLIFENAVISSNIHMKAELRINGLQKPSIAPFSSLMPKGARHPAMKAFSISSQLT
jgi:hypothetical protein